MRDAASRSAGGTIALDRGFHRRSFPVDVDVRSARPRCRARIGTQDSTDLVPPARQLLGGEVKAAPMAPSGATHSTQSSGRCFRSARC
jgi:hypothetical protein